ncbi:MAG: TonB-dependent receptor [Fidelibacterota bacterium]|nr:MAG: TonB-dependent receptor [Candidatus Neomarinimicrobiota bacterium]
MAAIVFVLYAHSSSLFAGTTGKISGVITNAITGEPLPGTNIVIEGTTMGAATDANGFYFIINVPPGYYTVSASMIGYTPMSKTLVQVVTDMTSKVDFQLSTTVLEGEAVRVIAERPAIQKDLTSSLQAYASDEIAGAPIENLSQLIEVQAGVSIVEPTERASILRDSPGDGLHIRGGRENETAFLVDGVRVDHPIWGGAAYSQNTSGSTVTEMMTILGTFNAEYGGKMSGVINLVTKQPPDRFTARFSGYTDKFGLKQFDRNTFQGEISLSGPIPVSKKLSFLFNTQTRTTDGRFRGYIIPNWADSKGKVAIEDSAGNPLGKEVSADWTDEWNTMFKLSYAVSPKLKLMGSYINAFIRQLKYYHDYKYHPYGMPWRETRTSGFTGKITYQISPSTFADMAFSMQNIAFWNGVHKTREQRILMGSRASEEEYGFYFTGAYNNFSQDSSTTYQLVLNLTSQVGTLHLFKIGVDARYLDLFHTLGNAWTTPVDIKTVGTDDDGNPIKEIYEINRAYAHAEPVELAAFIQDKMEFESIGMILNVGVRWERWNLGEKYMENPQIPFATPLLPTKPKDRISPRLGISYPISDKAAFHFAYGHFYQMASYVDLLSGINEKGEYPNRPNLQGIGLAIFNPNIRPEKSVTYEAGVQTRLMKDVTLNVTAFYREMADLVGVTWIQVEGYVYFENVDFGNAKGFEFTLNKRFSNYYSARVNYTISQTLISTSSPMTAAQTISSAPIVVRSFLADWDRTHNLTALIRFSDPGKWALSLTGDLKSGKPYSVLAEQPNTERMPWNANVNLKMAKYWTKGRLHGSLYLQVFNLFDRRNIYWVYPGTGKWNDDGDAGTPPAHDANPRRISDGRRARLGIGIEF